MPKGKASCLRHFGKRLKVYGNEKRLLTKRAIADRITFGATAAPLPFGASPIHSAYPKTQRMAWLGTHLIKSISIYSNLAQEKSANASTRTFSKPKDYFMDMLYMPYRLSLG
jgi:hypothetical protein